MEGGAVAAARPATAEQIVLARKLKAIREQARVGYKQAAEALGMHDTAIRRMEGCEVALKPILVRELLTLYGLPKGEIATFLDDVAAANRPAWWNTFRDVLPPSSALFVSLAGAASLIRSYEPQSVPDLLQTEDYARALLRARHGEAPEEEIERRVSLTMERQKRYLAAEPGPCTLWTILDETALRRSVGGPAVMGPQIEHLIQSAKLPHIQLQILPHTAGVYPGMGEPFHLFRFAAPELPDVVHRANLGGSEYLYDGTSAYLAGLDQMSVLAGALRDTPDFLRHIGTTVWSLRTVR
ncbi:helix-turn-helix domain-containing protein [Streptomyces goshikiensis]|uniref:helix-turn-helix domain-containing protein n=1 Tax=Streptomyces goshikiensis TaxID=1942 RepID=UPI0036AE9528